MAIATPRSLRSKGISEARCPVRRLGTRVGIGGQRVVGMGGHSWASPGLTSMEAWAGRGHPGVAFLHP